MDSPAIQFRVSVRSQETLLARRGVRGPTGLARVEQFVRPGYLKRVHEGRVPDVGHLLIAGVVGVKAVAEVSGGAETCVLVYDPDRRFGAVETLGPRDDSAVETLDEAEDVGSVRDDLGDLAV